MKAISIWQPWASLIAIGEKRIETRSWGTSYRGPILIHAAKTTRTLQHPSFALLARAGYARPADLPLGAFVAVADLVDCRPADLLIGRDDLPEHERLLGGYGPGRYGWLLDNNVRRLAEPVPARGQQGLWTPSAEDVLALQLQVIERELPKAAAMNESRYKQLEPQYPAGAMLAKCDEARILRAGLNRITHSRGDVTATELRTIAREALIESNQLERQPPP